MNKKQCFYVIAFFLLYKQLSCLAYDLEPFYTFSLDFPRTYSSKPLVSARCKGEKLSIREGSCTLPKGFVQDIFYIIILEQIEPCTSKKYAPKLKKLPGAACKYYCIVRNSTAAFNKEQEPWLISEIPLDEQAEILPENALIIFFNPKHSAGLKIVPTKGNQTKPIPTLVINTDIPEKEFLESIDTCALALLDTNMLHKSPTTYQDWAGSCLREYTV